jgi:hypothetical protein
MRLLMFVFGLPVLAHTLYLLPSKFHVMKEERLVFSIHNGDAFPASEDAVAPERIQDVQLIGPSGSTAISNFQRLGKAVHAVVPIEQEGTLWLAIRTKPNFLQLEAPKFEQYLRDEGLEHAIVWRAQHGESAKPSKERYTKYAKSLILSGTPDEGWKRTIGLPLEFVPEADPSRLTPGATLPVRVLWRGQPAKGLRVEKAWATGGKNGIEIVGRTDAEGRIQVPFEKAAKWRLHTVAIEPVANDPEANWESYWATLTFELPPTTH